VRLLELMRLLMIAYGLFILVGTCFRASGVRSYREQTQPENVLQEIRDHGENGRQMPGNMSQPKCIVHRRSSAGASILIGEPANTSRHVAIRYLIAQVDSVGVSVRK